jgi:hypothetical protein
MRENGMGRCSDSLYGQFIYRFLELNKSNNININFFSPPLIFSGVSYKNLRKILFEKFIFEKGFMMDAANFADVKSWGLTFSVLKSKKI